MKPPFHSLSLKQKEVSDTQILGFSLCIGLKPPPFLGPTCWQSLQLSILCVYLFRHDYIFLIQKDGFGFLRHFCRSVFKVLLLLTENKLKLQPLLFTIRQSLPEFRPGLSRRFFLRLKSRLKNNKVNYLYGTFSRGFNLQKAYVCLSHTLQRAGDIRVVNHSNRLSVDSQEQNGLLPYISELSLSVRRLQRAVGVTGWIWTNALRLIKTLLYH